MRARRSWFGLLGTLALAGLPAPAGAQPVGSEFQVNTYTTSSQRTYSYGGHSVASDASGNFVVVWFGQGQGDNVGIFGQRYDSSGVALGSEFRVNSSGGSQLVPSVASDASGNFVVVWEGRGQGDFYGIFGQRYDSGGMRLGAEFRVNSYTTGFQLSPSIGSDASGNFVVVWWSLSLYGYQYGSDIFAQRYDNAGSALGDEFRVNSYTPSYQIFPSVASEASGNFVVVWQDRYQDGSDDGIFGQRYDNAGSALGDEFRVNSFTPGYQIRPSVASDASGNFVVVWECEASYPRTPCGVFGQRYDSEGMARGGEFQVNSYTTDDQSNPSVASDADGNFVVAWQRGTFLGDYEVFGQRYDSEGVGQGDEFQINSFSIGPQQHPSVGTTGTNQFVVVWESSGQDGSGYGVFGKRFDFGGAAITVVSPNTNVKWRVGSLQRIKWTYNLGIDATFRIELDRDDDGSYEERIATEAPVDSATKGHFGWTVTGPASATARVRVSWTDDPAVADSSDVTFQIRPSG